MTKTIHPIAGGIALLMILTFWLSTTLSELFGGSALVTTVKTLIPWGFIILIPAMMTVGGSGFRLGEKMRGPLVAAKRKRMMFVAANGILILMPSALYLSFKAQAGVFVRIRVAHFRGNRDLFGKLREKLAPHGVLAPFAVLDICPF